VAEGVALGLVTAGGDGTIPLVPVGEALDRMASGVPAVVDGPLILVATLCVIG